MSNFRRFLSRRWLFGVALVVVSLPMLHPFVRQALFGPTIDGIPWCVWEDEARRQVDEGEPRPQWWLAAALEKLGILRGDGVKLDLHSTAALPLHLHLADDRDVKVRRFALGQLQVRLGTRQPKHQAEITATLRRHFDDVECRLTAAYGVWATATEVQTKQIVLAGLDQNDQRLRAGATAMLSDMASAAPDLFEPLAKLTEDADFHVKTHALRGMYHFGKRGAPMLRKGLFDSDNRIRNTAIYITSTLGKHGMELTPILQAFAEDPDLEIRNSAAHALYRMDPKQFAKPAEIE